MIDNQTVEALPPPETPSEGTSGAEDGGGNAVPEDGGGNAVLPSLSELSLRPEPLFDVHRLKL